ncbi:MAG: hypothetical protein HZC36_07815 [Armatimonadetes bacterium]|nr:hypothetical protein [Armatimonadota bacterium]
MISRRYIPTWRRPKPKPKRWLPTQAFGVLSVVAGVLLWYPLFAPFWSQADSSADVGHATVATPFVTHAARVPRPQTGRPDWTGVNMPISVQLSKGHKDAWTLFAVLGLIGMILMVRLAASGNPGIAFVLAMDLGLLGGIASTDPYSVNHLFMFICAALISSTWLALAAREMEDPWITALVICAIVGMGLCFKSMGFGERVLIASMVLGMNLMYYRHVAVE